MNRNFPDLDAITFEFERQGINHNNHLLKDVTRLAAPVSKFLRQHFLTFFSLRPLRNQAQMGNNESTLMFGLDQIIYLKKMVKTQNHIDL